MRDAKKEWEGNPMLQWVGVFERGAEKPKKTGLCSRKVGGLLLVVMFLLSPALSEEYAQGQKVLEIAPVWSGHPVGFCLLTHPPSQFVAFYDADRRMTVAARSLDSDEWKFVHLPENLGWDSHNGIVMVVDGEGCLHLAGNMHVHPLKYFRTRKPLDIDTFERVPSMVGSNEDRVTYPRFLSGPQDELLFTYRDGKSGSGNQIYNVYDLEKRAWRRLLDRPLVDGRGQMNAYFDGPRKGPDGFYHLCWVWRDTPDCATNHDLSYARSPELVHWETSSGTPLSLPITFETAEVVDPVPPGGGAINGNAKIGFDTQNRPVIAFHKYDENGITQLYNARVEDGTWRIHQSSDWDYRWEFSGGGSIPFEIRIEPVRVDADGRLVQSWSHSQYGRETWMLDEVSLKPLKQLPPRKSPFSSSMKNVESSFPGMQTRFCNDSGTSGDPSVRYFLRWETLGPNRDRPREKPWPEPSMLTLHQADD